MTLAADDPTNEVGAAWAVKERLRQLLQADTLEHAEQSRAILVDAVALAAMPETDRLLATVQAWWPAIEVLVVTGVTNARTEAANTSIKHIKEAAAAQSGPLQGPYPPRQRRLTSSVNTHISTVDHVEVRRACKGESLWRHATMPVARSKALSATTCPQISCPVVTPIAQTVSPCRQCPIPSTG